MSAWTCRHTDGKVVQKIVPPRPRIPWWKGPGADSEEKQEPASDIDTALVDSLKVLDPKGPIREADIRHASQSRESAVICCPGTHLAFWGEGVRLHGENACEGTRWKDRVRDRCSVRHWTRDRDRLRPGGGES